MKKLVLFGAGKIGRSFIGQLFSRGGYEVVFIDIFQPVIDALNQQRKYKIIIKSNSGDNVLMVENVRAVLASETEKVISELLTADIAAVSVGQQGLPMVIELLAEALRRRHTPLDCIIAENLRDAAEYFAEEIKKINGHNFPVHERAGLIETSIGKMVPIMLKKDVEQDILQVFAEPYNTLILDKKGFKNPVPDIEGLAPKDNMKAWVDRKLFIHNLGHAATAYLGYQKNPQWKYIWEVLGDEKIKDQVRETMMESAQILMAIYTYEFSFGQLMDHIEDLLTRFENKALGDTVFRVGCDLQRKLGRNDRLAGAIVNAQKTGLSYHLILQALAAGFTFRATDEDNCMHPGDIEFAQLFKENGYKAILSNICGFDPVKDKQIFNHPIFTSFN